MSASILNFHDSSSTHPEDCLAPIDCARFALAQDSESGTFVRARTTPVINPSSPRFSLTTCVVRVAATENPVGSRSKFMDHIVCSLTFFQENLMQERVVARSVTRCSGRVAPPSLMRYATHAGSDRGITGCR